MAAHRVIAEARIGARHQLTLPDAVAQAGYIAEGDRFAAEFDAGDPDVVRLHNIRPSYAGALQAVYGEPGQVPDDARQGWE
jgi:hypothetical protein